MTQKQPSHHFPLRWESTGDQWWFASPIDWAAANGHYDVVLELLHMDTNLLIHLTSLPRIRRLETVWDDDVENINNNLNNVAKNRSKVAYKLMLECENGNQNSLIKSGYGGWLLYTAASAGDVVFVKELLGRDSNLVFGEGEYGVTDVFYAAARSGNLEVFKMIFDCSVSRGLKEGFRSEMRNRAVHAAGRGGSVEILREVLGEGCDVLSFVDAQGGTVLHTASGRGQVEVVKYLISSYDIISCTDNRGNTALHVAAYRGHLPVMEVLVSASPSSVSSTNNYGDTFLHMVVAGFRSPGFRRLDRQVDLIRQLVNGKLTNIEELINVQNNDGRTAIHMAVIDNIPSEVVELLMSVRYINLNARDADGNTPLDILKQRPRSASSEILIKRLISAGGISNCHDRMARNALASHLRMHGIGRSPGTSFRVPDAEMLLYAGIDDICPSSCDFTSTEQGYSGEIERVGSKSESNSSKYKRLGSINRATRRLKMLLRWAGKRDGSTGVSESEDNYSVASYETRSSFKYSPVPLRQQFSRVSSLPNNRRITSLNRNNPSPLAKKKFAAGLTHGVLQVLPKSNLGSPSSAFSESSWPSTPVPRDKGKHVDHECESGGPSSSNQSPNVGKVKMKKHGSLNLKLMNNYFCFGAQGLAVEKSINSPRQTQNQQRIVV